MISKTTNSTAVWANGHSL